jgi:type I restriction enzyme, S subunit
MSEWKEYSLGELTNWFSGGTPSKENKEFWSGNIPWISAKTMTNYKVSTSELNITEKGLSNGSRLALENDILLLVRGSGLFNDIPINLVDKPVAYNQDIKAIRAKKSELQKFIFFWLHGNKKGLNDILEETGIGAGKLDTDLLKKLSISIPTNKVEFDFIVQTSEALFNKIDLLHRQNATLEKMAETLFRQWFVEEAKEEWETGKVSDLIKILSGFAFKSSSFVESGKYRLITIKGVQDGYLELNNADNIEELPNRMPDFCKLQIGDILLSLTGNVGRCCLVDTTYLLLNQRVAKLHPINERDRAYTYFLFRQPQIKQLLEEMGKGTAQSNLSPIETSNIELQIPDKDILNQFSAIATPWLKKILFNKKSIQNLTSLRDNLLPKLMSGEVKVEMN